MGPGTAQKFRAGLEMTGGITMAIAIGTSLFVQTNVWGAVRSNGKDEEDDDYKVRTEQRRLQEMEQAIEEQKVIVRKLRDAHDVLRKEKQDAEAAMRVHVDLDCFENPLQKPSEEADASPRDKE